MVSASRPGLPKVSRRGARVYDAPPRRRGRFPTTVGRTDGARPNELLPLPFELGLPCVGDGAISPPRSASPRLAIEPCERQGDEYLSETIARRGDRDAAGRKCHRNGPTGEVGHGERDRRRGRTAASRLPPSPTHWRSAIIFADSRPILAVNFRSDLSGTSTTVCTAIDCV